MCIQGVQQNQMPVHMENGLHGTTGTDNQSSYVSSSGIKSVLLNAWSTVKSAVSGMLSSFGLHLSGEQGSDKPGREIVTDMSCRPLPLLPLPGMDEQFDKRIYISNNNKDIYSEIEGDCSEDVDYYSVIGDDCSENEDYYSVIEDDCSDDGDYYSVIEDYCSEDGDYYSVIKDDCSEIDGYYSEIEGDNSEVDENESSEVDVLENNTYEDPDVYRKGNGETGTAEADDPAKHIYEDPEADNPEDHTYEDPDVYRDTDNVVDSGSMVLVCDDTYVDPRDSLTAGGREEQEGIDSKYESLHANNYAVPYKPGNMVSIPDNDRKQSLPDAQLQQRIMRERLNIS